MLILSEMGGIVMYNLLLVVKIIKVNVIYLIIILLYMEMWCLLI